MKKHLPSCNGFSIIELLVAATIMAVTVVAVVSMIRKGRDIQLVDKHRQEVRAILNGQFEEVYNLEQYTVIHEYDSIGTIAIDPRMGDTLKGIYYLWIDSTSENVSGTQIPVKKVSLAVAWNEAEGEERDSVHMSKWIAEW